MVENDVVTEIVGSHLSRRYLLRSESGNSILPKHVTLHTSMGDICLELFPDLVPRTVENVDYMTTIHSTV